MATLATAPTAFTMQTPIMFPPPPAPLDAATLAAQFPLLNQGPALPSTSLQAAEDARTALQARVAQIACPTIDPTSLVIHRKTQPRPC